MLDRLPTELIELVIDAAAASIWTRKATIDRLGLVNKSYRAVTRPLRIRIVQVTGAEGIVELRSWPAWARKSVETVLIGTNEPGRDRTRLFEADINRLMALLPQVKAVFMEGLEGCYRSKLANTDKSTKLWFELEHGNPFRSKLLSTVTCLP